jgi:hypothetical protein
MSLHPGLVKTDLTRYTGFLAQRVGRMLSYDVSYGAITSLYAGTAPAAGELNGKVGTAYMPVDLPLTSWLACDPFLVPHGVGTRRGSEQDGARRRAGEEAVGMV